MDIQRVLVPVDFSAASLNAVLQATRLVDPQGLFTLHAVPPPQGLWNRSAESPDLRVRHLMGRWLDESGTPSANRLVGHGDPGTVIARVARQVGAGLIVLPSHSRADLGRPRLGPVAERVVRHAPCPVLVLCPPRSDDPDDPPVARHALPGRVHTVVVAFDGSESATRAMDAAAGFATRPSHLHVHQVLLTLDYEAGWIWPARDDEERRNHARAALASLLRDEGLGAAKVHVTLGSPPAVLLESARHLDPGLVVMGRRGTTREADLSLGSVTARFLRASAWPVLVVP